MSVYTRPGPQIVAAIRALGVAPPPATSKDYIALQDAAAGARMRVVTVTDGITVTHDPNTDGLWEAPELGAARGKGPAADRLQTTLAACLRLCWDDPDTPMLPGKSVPYNVVIDLATYLRAASDASASSAIGATRHVVGSVRTLAHAGFLVQDDDQIRLGHALGSWSEHDLNVLRQAWDRIPAAADIA
ncbi:hypothetical protein DDP54_07760 [Cellulomonas sp. WB94]|uniref:hypothetical protein n=1 Tax=Cellulomonas sp. WB94 TaxID=2173174 RepID=UPI000D56F1D2|nr:hypothetical protein [Cellulomonas sp. WB94]PVU82915.1 hypothetical protein DDP54_07760 [Cellulomonas sp. WB94]